MVVSCLLVSRPASSSTATTGTLPSHFYSRWRRQQRELDSESDSIESIYKTLSAPHVRTTTNHWSHVTHYAKYRCSSHLKESYRASHILNATSSVTSIYQLRNSTSNLLEALVKRAHWMQCSNPAYLCSTGWPHKFWIFIKVALK